MMSKTRIFICSISILLCTSCYKQAPLNQVEETVLNFCVAFYNLNYPEAKDWVTPSSQAYLSFLASNIQDSHLKQLKVQGGAHVSILSCEINTDAESAKVICEITNSLKINPISGNTKEIASMQDTLWLTKIENKWLIRKDNLRQSERQNRD